jgi:hypothetical protein
LQSRRGPFLNEANEKKFQRGRFKDSPRPRFSTGRIKTAPNRDSAMPERVHALAMMRLRQASGAGATVETCASWASAGFAIWLPAVRPPRPAVSPSRRSLDDLFSEPRYFERRLDGVAQPKNAGGANLDGSALSLATGLAALRPPRPAVSASRRPLDDSFFRADEAVKDAPHGAPPKAVAKRSLTASSARKVLWSRGRRRGMSSAASMERPAKERGRRSPRRERCQPRPARRRKAVLPSRQREPSTS